MNIPLGLKLVHVAIPVFSVNTFQSSHYREEHTSTMSATDKAKTERTSAKRQLTMSINNLKTAVADERHTKVVEDRFESVKVQ